METWESAGQMRSLTARAGGTLSAPNLFTGFIMEGVSPSAVMDPTFPPASRAFWQTPLPNLLYRQLF